MVSGFEFAVGAKCGVGLVMEAAVGQRTAEAFMKEQQQERNLGAFGSELIGVAGAIPFQQAVPFEFAQVLAELI